MIKSLHKPLMLSAVVLAALAFTSGVAKAQTENVTATVEVLNALTLTEVDPLDFGIVAAISDAADTARLTIDASTGALAAFTTGAPAVFAVIDNATASRAQITVEDGADGAVLNFTINNVVNPLFGGNAFTLTGWETSWNGGAVTAQAFNVPFTYTFAAAFNAGVNELNIGAEVVTQTAVPVYADGIYAGSFDVVASY